MGSRVAASPEAGAMGTRSSAGYALRFLSSAGHLTLTIVASLSFSVASARAEDKLLGGGNEGGAVRVYVRTIEATNPEQPSELATEAASSPSIDPALEDLHTKLQQLPFSSYKLICKRQQLLSVLEKDTMQLPRGQSLAFRPIYMDEKRVGLWLSWKDANGGDILNTRLHFDTDDSVLTGTDAAQDAGLILAIKAEAAER